MNYANQLHAAAEKLLNDPNGCPWPEIAEPLADCLNWEARWMEEHDATDTMSGINSIARVVLGGVP